MFLGIALAALIGPIIIGMGIRYKKPKIAKKIIKVIIVMSITNVICIKRLLHKAFAAKDIDL